MASQQSSEVSRYYETEWSRNADALGSYAVGLGTITLSEAVSVFDDHGSVNPRDPTHWAIFLHEYLHFLHNYSTMVGLQQMMGAFWLAGMYGRTLSPAHDGTSLGTDPSDAEGIRLFEELSVAVRHFNGPSSFAYSAAKRIEVLRTELTAVSLAPLRTAKVVAKVLERGNWGNVHFDLTPMIIEEGLAAIFEDRYLASVAHEPTKRHYYPYQVLRDVVKTFVPDARDEVIFRLGTMSMNTTNPGAWLLDTLEVNRGVSDGELDARVRAYNWSTVYGGAHADILVKLEALEGSFAQRGLLADGFHSVAEWARALLQRRAHDPVFEIEETVNDQASFNRLVTEILPCEVVLLRESRDEPFRRDVMLRFYPPALDREFEGRRALQSVVHAMRNHWHGTRFVATPPRLSAAQCPHFTYCEQKKRKTYESVCAKAPWLTLGHARREDCWYSSGMLGLVATISRPRVVTHEEK